MHQTFSHIFTQSAHTSVQQIQYIPGMLKFQAFLFFIVVPDNKVHRANIGPTWVLSAPDGPHVGPMNLAIRGVFLVQFTHVIHSINGSTDVPEK